MAVKHLLEFIGFLVVLWLIWFFTGGPARSDKDKPYINPAAPISTGDTYGPTR